jgi:phosphoglycerate kinase
MLASKLRIDQIAQKLRDRRVLMRVDFNVPVRNGKVVDSSRITASLPTIHYALDHGAEKIVLLSHLGQPNGQKTEKDSLLPVAEVLRSELGRPVTFLDNCYGDAVRSAIDSLPKSSVVLLENVRFHPEEEGSYKNTKGEKVKVDRSALFDFRHQLSLLGEIFVNDAFGAAHRAHSSVVGIDLAVRAAGLLMGKEMNFLSMILETPAKPLTFVMGGAKLKDKILMIENILNIADEIVLVGGMSYTFLKKLKGIRIGNSLFDSEAFENHIERIVAKAQQKGVKLTLPVDYRVGSSLADTNATVVEGDISGGLMGLDIGPKTEALIGEVIHRSKTVFWNGPVGVFENPAFRSGSESVLRHVIEGTETRGLVSIVGGGDSAAFLKSAGPVREKLTYVSTGGGASLELLEGKALPGIVALSDAN